MTQYLLRTCKGDTDDEISVEPIFAEGLTFEERQHHAQAQAQAAIDHAIDVAVSNDAENGVSHSHVIRDDRHGRYYHTMDGVSIINIQAVIGEQPATSVEE